MVKWCQVNKHKTHDQLQNTHDFHELKIDLFSFAAVYWCFFKVNLQHTVFLAGNLYGIFFHLCQLKREISAFYYREMDVLPGERIHFSIEELCTIYKGPTISVILFPNFGVYNAL